MRCCLLIFFFKQKTAYEMRISDWSSDVCSSDLPHYRKCFIERSARASADADIVIANHALVMINAARGRETGQAPQRIVIDEGHHLLAAADSNFSVALSGQAAIELPRRVLGRESSEERRGGKACVGTCSCRGGQ